MDRTPVEVRRATYPSGGRDDVWQVLSRTYARARPGAATGSPTMEARTATTPSLAADQWQLTPAAGAFDPSPHQLTFVTVLSGHITHSSARTGATDHGPGDSFLHLPDRGTDLEWGTIRARPIRLPTSFVARWAHQQTGIDPGDVRFTSPHPISSEHASLWRRTAQILGDQVGDGTASTIPPLVYSGLVNLAAASAIAAFPNTVADRGYLQEAGDVRPAAVRRAVAYIDAHLSLAITVSDIARATGITARDLQAAFRRHLGMTVGDHLRRTRLQAADRDIRAPDPQASLPDIAARWGFENPGQFISAYSATYGPPPAGLG